MYWEARPPKIPSHPLVTPTEYVMNIVLMRVVVLVFSITSKALWLRYNDYRIGTVVQ